MNLLVRVLYILLAIALVILTYYIVIWVLRLLGITVPDQILTVIFVILGLLAAIGALTGRMDTWWPPKA
jgi:putative effector of murein hydrolase LrgA (UPF0299 family)